MKSTAWSTRTDSRSSFPTIPFKTIHLAANHVPVTEASSFVMPGLCAIISSLARSSSLHHRANAVQHVVSESSFVVFGAEAGHSVS